MRCDRFVLAALILAGGCRGAEMVPVPELGLRVARGFRVSQYADPILAPDVTAMILDAHGRVVVTGPGYIRTLLAPDGQGRATAFRDFAPTQSGGQGLCFDGDSLYFVGDGVLAHYTDADGDGVADGPPSTLVGLKTTSKGAHSVRKGPDGAIYFSAGEDVQVSIRTPAFPVQQAGGIFRLMQGGPELVAHGLRNPCDFDFNGLGDFFTSDIDAERDLLLPWYSPARIFHAAYGGQHGWHRDPTQHTWSHPDSYPDTVNALARLGSARITGMLCYRHNQFPPHYRDGLFVCDWANGRVYYVPLQLVGVSYQSEPELFLEAIGANGFAPSDIAVTPDGALLISTGGQKTRGGVYVVEFGPAAPMASDWWSTAADDLEAVLMAPQPMDAWSRAWWVPAAQTIGPVPFKHAATDPALTVPFRVRAIEILTELHGGLGPEAAEICAQAAPPPVRARLAWSLGRVPTPNFRPLITALAKDPDPIVRRCALESILQQMPLTDLSTLEQTITPNFAHPDKHVRQLAARLASTLPEANWQTLWAQKLDAPSRLTAILAWLWRPELPGVNQEAIESAMSVLAQTRNPDQRLQALGLIVMALGDYDQDSSLELYASYETQFSLESQPELLALLRAQVRSIFPSGTQTVDLEAARLLAILEDDDANTPGKVLSMITEASTPSADFHYLTVLSHLKAQIPDSAGPSIAKAILALDRKLAGRERNTLLNWQQRLVEMADRLVRREPTLPAALLADKNFPTPAHVGLVQVLDEASHAKAVPLFEAAVRQNPNAGWSEDILTVLESLPENQRTAIYRQLWVKTSWRERIIQKMAAAPNPADFEKYLTSLTSTNTAVRQACLSALLRLPPNPKSYLTGARLLLRLCDEPAEAATRQQALAFLNRATGQSFKVQETRTQRTDLLNAYQPVFRWIATQDLQAWKALESAESEDPSNWNAALSQVSWQRGDPALGAELFHSLGCAACHATRNPLGPDLTGIAQRYSLTNLFYAIVYPGRQIAPAYRATTFQLRGGQTYTGLLAYESPEVVLLNTRPQGTVRLYSSEIVSREPSTNSLMPAGLLKGMRSLSLADLYAYLQRLKIEQPEPLRR